MSKKIIFLITVIVSAVFLIVASLSFYFFWQGGPRLRSINKNLPEGIRVEKRNGQEVVVNKLDDYEITAPKDWSEFKKVEYRKIDSEKIVDLESVNSQLIEIKTFSDTKKEIEEWLRERWANTPGVYIKPEVLGNEKIGKYIVLKVKDFGGEVGDIFFYYLKANSKIYEFTSDSEKSIKDIILNGNF